MTKQSYFLNQIMRQKSQSFKYMNWMDDLVNYLWELILVTINHTENCTSVMLLKIYFLLSLFNFSPNNFLKYFTFFVFFNICKGFIIFLANCLIGKNLEQNFKQLVLNPSLTLSRYMALEKSFRFLRLFSHMVKEKVKKKKYHRCAVRIKCDNSYNA